MSVPNQKLFDMINNDLNAEADRRASLQSMIQSDLAASTEGFTQPVKMPEPGFLKSIGTSALGSAGSGIAGVGTALEDVGLQRLGTPVREYGEGIQQANPSSISQFSDILDKPKQFAGEALGQIGSSIAATGGGALIGRGLGTAIGAALPIPGAAPALGALGGLAGGFASNLAGEYGETRANQREMGFNDPSMALAAAVPAAALDYAADRYVGKIGKLGQLDAIPQGMTRPGFMAQEALKGALIEGPITEVPQTVLERLGGGKDIASNEALNEYGIAGAMGALGGGVVSGGIGGFAPYAPPTQQDTIQPGATPAEQPAEPQQPMGLGSQWETPAFTNYPRQPDVLPTSPLGMTPEEETALNSQVEPSGISSDARQPFVNLSSDARNAEPQGLGSRWQTPAFTINPNQPVLGDVLAGAPNESPETPVAPGTDRVGSAGPEAAAVDPVAAGGPNAGNEPRDGLLSSTRQFNTAPGLATDPAPAAPPGRDVAGSPGAEAGQPNRDVLDAGQGAVDEAQNTGLVDQAQVEERKPWRDFFAEEQDPAMQGSILRTVAKRTQDPQDLADVLDSINPQTMADSGNVAYEVLKSRYATDETKAKAQALVDAIPALKELDEPAEAKSADDWLNIHQNTRTVYDAEGIPHRVAAEQPPARGREEVTGTTTDYAKRNQQRINRIAQASTQDEMDAVMQDESSDPERHFEGYSGVERAIRDRQFALEQDAKQQEEQKRYEAGEWTRVNTGIMSASYDSATQSAARLQAEDPDNEYTVAGDNMDGWEVRRRKLQPQEPTDATPTPRDPGSDATSLSGGSRPTGAGELGVAGGTEPAGRETAQDGTGGLDDGTGGTGVQPPAATGDNRGDSVNRPALDLPDSYRPYQDKIARQQVNTARTDVSSLSDALDANKRPTGWKYFEDNNGVAIINPATGDSYRYKADPKSGTDLARARVVMGNLAADLKAEQPEPPKDDLVVTPLFNQTKPSAPQFTETDKDNRFKLTNVTDLGGTEAVRARLKEAGVKVPGNALDDNTLQFHSSQRDKIFKALEPTNDEQNQLPGQPEQPTGQEEGTQTQAQEEVGQPFGDITYDNIKDYLTDSPDDDLLDHIANKFDIAPSRKTGLPPHAVNRVASLMGYKKLTTLQRDMSRDNVGNTIRDVVDYVNSKTSEGKAKNKQARADKLAYESAVSLANSRLKEQSGDDIDYQIAMTESARQRALEEAKRLDERAVNLDSWWSASREAGNVGSVPEGLSAIGQGPAGLRQNAVKARGQAKELQKKIVELAKRQKAANAPNQPAPVVPQATQPDNQRASEALLATQVEASQAPGTAQGEQPDTQGDDTAAQSDAPDEDALTSVGLLRQWNNRWQYKGSTAGGWMTANSREGAVESATEAWNKTPPEQRLTRDQRYQKASEELYADMDARYGNKSLSELDAELGRMDAQIAGLQRTDEITGQGTRRTGPAVSNEGARQVGEEKLRLGIYARMRREREGQGNVTGNVSSTLAPTAEQPNAAPVTAEAPTLNIAQRGQFNGANAVRKAMGKPALAEAEWLAEQQGAPASRQEAGAAATRTKPENTIQFSSAITGPSGAKMDSYTWQWREEDQADRNGEMRPRRVSDWEKAGTSDDTGRDIVHQFMVTKPDGSQQMMSAESAIKALGYAGADARGVKEAVTTSKTLARLQMASEQATQSLQTLNQDLREIKAVQPDPIKTINPSTRHTVYQVGDVEGKTAGDAKRLWRVQQLKKRGWDVGDSAYDFQDEIAKKAERIQDRLAKAQYRLDGILSKQPQSAQPAEQPPQNLGQKLKANAEKEAEQKEQREYNYKRLHGFVMMFDHAGNLPKADAKRIYRKLESYAKGNATLDEAMSLVEQKLGRNPGRMWVNERPKNARSPNAEQPTQEPAPDTQTPNVSDTLRNDPEAMERVASLVAQAGWAQKGGYLYRLADGTPQRTDWLPKTDWWLERPDGTTEKDFKETLTRLQSGRKLSPKQERVADFLNDLQAMTLPAEDVVDTGHEQLDEKLAAIVDELVENALRDFGEDAVNAVVAKASANAEGRSVNTYYLGIKYGIREIYAAGGPGPSQANNEADSRGAGEGDNGRRQDSQEPRRPATQTEAFGELSAEDKPTADRLAIQDREKELARRRDASQAPRGGGLFDIDNRQDDIFNEPAETPTNDRDSFTIERVEDDKPFTLTFKRGETVKVAGKYPMETGTIDGISHANKEAKVRGVWHAFGYIYPADYDEYAGPRAEALKQIDRLRQHLDSGSFVDAVDMLRDLDRQISRFGLTDLQEQADALKEQALQNRQAFTAKMEADREKQRERAAENERKRQAKAAAQDNSPIEMTMEEWKKIGKDAKGRLPDGTRSVLRDGRLRAVTIIKPEGAKRVVSDKAKAEQEQAATGAYTLESHRAFWKRVADGEVKADEFKATFAKYQAAKDDLKAELNQRTLKQLAPNGARGMTKAQLIDEVVRDMGSRFSLSKSISYMLGAPGGYEAAVASAVEKITDADLESYAQRMAEDRAESQQRAEKVKAAIADPKTLEDFQLFMRSQMSEGKTQLQARQAMTPEQRAKYDELAASASRDARMARADQQKTQVNVTAQTTSGSVIETQHTRTGEALFVVQASDRVDRDTYNQWNTTAKRMGGYYSSFRGRGAVPGFQFKTRENADAFLAYLGGNAEQAQSAVQTRRDAFADDKSQSAVERLTTMADRLEEQADATLNADRKTNTARRVNMANAIEARANADKAMAKTMRNLAGAIASGQVKFLDRVRQKVQVEMLDRLTQRARAEELREQYPNYADRQNQEGKPPTGETIDYAAYPVFSAYRSDLARLGRVLSEQEGTKKLGATILKVADDVTEAYLKFAKENLQKVSTFTRANGAGAIFPSREAAETAIRRSGFKGQAIVLQTRRGENVIIMSPSMARELGVWQGDDDSRVTLSGEIGAEIVAKTKRRDVPVPATFEGIAADRARLESMGIETLQELRAALREYVSYKQAPAEKDAIKAMERSMVGRANDGLDFFPTSPDVVNDMIAAAEIEPGMSVLEPSAGMGHIADRIRENDVSLDVVEMSPSRRELLQAKGYNLVGDDFMELGKYRVQRVGKRGASSFSALTAAEETLFNQWRKSTNARTLIIGGRVEVRADGYEAALYDADKMTEGDAARYYWKENVKGDDAPVVVRYDRILMNPPFSKRRDAEHVRHAYDLLKPGGRLVAIMGEGVFYGQDAKAREFRDWLESVGGTSEKLPEGTFMDPSLPVNTGVNARMVVVDKAEGERAMFSREQNPIFYSQLARAFDSAKSNAMPGHQWASWIKGNAAKLGVKADEIAWTGIDDYLTLRAKEKVSKQEIAEYLSQNGVQVQDVMKGGTPVTLTLPDEWYFDDATDEGYEGEIALYDERGTLINTGATEEEALEGARDRVLAELQYDQERGKAENSTKFSTYTIPGGTNYRELLITLPPKLASNGYVAIDEWGNIQQAFDDKAAADSYVADRPGYRVERDARLADANQYRSSHWDEPNVLAHLRFDERTDAEGNRVMFIQELQSDWGQEGKKKGFGQLASVDDTLRQGGIMRDEWERMTPERQTQLRQQVAGFGFKSSVPNAPFVTDTKAWVSLALKRAIRYAAENGFDKIAFANGQQNADLYDLSKQVDEIAVIPKADGSRAVRLELSAGQSIKLMVDDKGIVSNAFASGAEFAGKPLDEVVGKEVADRILAAEKDTKLSGVDLKVGGEGMRYFYDSLIPSVANDVLKKLGGPRVGAVSIGGTATYEQLAEAGRRTGLSQRELDAMPVAERKALIDSMLPTQPGFTLTPELREKALGGLPLFARPGRPVQQKVGAILSRDAVQARIDAIRPKLRINPNVKILAVDSEAELPADIQAQARKEGAVGQVIAVHQGNSIYLVAGKHDSAAKVEESILHESNHYGANVLFGRAKHAIYNRLFNQLGGEKGIRDYANRLGLKMEPYFATARESRGNLSDMRVNSYLVDEFLANAQGTKAYATLPQKIKTAIQEFYGAIRNWLRQQGFADLAKFTDADLAYLLRSIHKAAQGNAASGRGKPMFMREFSRQQDINKPIRQPGNPLTLIKNPTFAKAYAMAKADRFGEIRLVRDPTTGDVYIAPAASTLHELIADVAGLPHEPRNPASPWYNSDDLAIIKADHIYRGVYDRYFAESAEETPMFSRSPTIDVDGVQRPTTNSEGRPIHPTEEGLRNFWRWFGSSRVTDEQGRPIVVYHGTTGERTTFEPYWRQLEREAMPYEIEGDGSIAKMYRMAKSEPEMHFFFTERGSAETYGGDVVEAYLRVTDPASNEDRDAALNAMLDGDMDGATFNDTTSSGRFGGTAWAVRASNQIKSATDNTGAFSPDNNDIRFSRRYTPEQGGWNTPVESRMDDLIRTLQNKHIDTKRVVEAIKEARGAIEDRFDPELKIDLYDGRVANRLNEFLLNEVEPFYKALGKSGVSVEELEKYLHARHAEERNEQMAKVNKAFPDGGSGMTNQEAWDYLASVPNRAALDKLAEQVDAINRGTKRLLVDEGLETQATIDAWDGAYQHYVPLFREEAEGEQRFGNGTGPGFSVRGPASKRAMGSSRNVVDILANSVMARERALTRAEKNRVSTALFGAAAQNPADDFWRAVDPDKSAKEDMQDWLGEQGLDEVEIEDLWREPRKRVLDKRTGQVAYRLSIPDRFKDNVVSLRIDGRDKFIFFNQNNPRALEMAKALKNLDTHDLGTILTGMRYVTRWVSSVNTQFNPIFGITNIIRDTGAGLLNLESTDLKGQQLAVLREVPNALMGIYRDVRADRKGQPRSTSAYSKLFEEYEAAGGETGYRDMFRTSQDRADALQKIIDPSAWADTGWGKLFTANGKLKAPYEMVRRAAKPLFDWLSDYNRTLENGVRLAAYKVAKDNGMSVERAAQLAKNLTVNFNKKGQIAQQAGAMYAFFNASMQGSARIAETLLDKRGNLSESGKMIVKGGMLLGVAQALMLAGYDDDEPPEFVREKNFVIPLPSGKYASFPYPLGFHILPNTGRVLTDILLRGKPGDRVASLLGSFIDAFNPIGSAGMSLQTLTPTAIDPLAALAENKDWTGKPIAKENFSSLSPTPGFTRAKDTASWFGKAIAEMANTLSGGTDYVPGAFSPTPDQIDYLIGQATGGVGRELMKAQQLGTSLVTGEEIPPYKVPGLGRFFGSVNSQAAESSRFYDNLTHLNMVENTLRGMRKDGKNVAEYLRETPEARLVKLSNTIETDIRELRARKRALIEKNAPKMQVQFIENAITSKMKRLNEAVSRFEK